MAILSKLLRTICKDVVTIEVGEEKEKFLVDKAMLSASSKYFKTAFEGEFKESKQKSIPLLDITPLEFRRFLAWLYYREVPGGQLVEFDDDDEAPLETEEKERQERIPDPCGKSCPCKNGPEEIDTRGIRNPYTQFKPLSEKQEEELEAFLARQCMPNSRLYFFADRYEIPELRKDIMDFLWFHHNSYDSSLRWSTIVQVAAQLSISSPLSRFWFDLFIERYCHSREVACPIEITCRQMVPPEFMFAIMAGLSNKNHGEEYPGMKELCAYHEHSDEETAAKECVGAGERSRNRRRKIDDLKESARRVFG